MKISQGFKRGSKWRTNSPAYPFLLLIQQFHVATRSTSPDITLVFHTWYIYKDIEQPQEEKLHKTNQGSNFLEGCFSDRDNVRAPIQFGRKNQSQYLKRSFFLKNKPFHFHINTTSVIRPIKQNQLSFFSIEINQLLPAPVNSVS